MIIVKRSTLIYLFLSFLFGLGFLTAFYIREPQVKFGDHYIKCNPKAMINFKKSYHLQLWDYNWPIKDSGIQYRAYLQQAIRDFQKTYPNIHIEIRLLDLINGPTQLEQALKKNNGPDVYCSAYMIPKFNFKRQIPVGFYLNKKEIFILFFFI
jgi:maltose-binding protein MalE